MLLDRLLRIIQELAKKNYYYAIVVKEGGGRRGVPPIPIAEMLTNDNSTPSIEYFLTKLIRDAQAIHRTLVPKQVEVDFSWAMLNATCMAFMRCSVSAYLRKSWDGASIVTAAVHVCSTHILRAIYKKLPNMPKEQNKFLKLVCASLIDT